MKIIKIEKAPPVPPTPTTFTVELNEHEITLISLLMGKIGGDPLKSYRKHVDSILKATESVVDTDPALTALEAKMRSKIDRTTNSSIYFLVGE